MMYGVRVAISLAGVFRFPDWILFTIKILEFLKNIPEDEFNVFQTYSNNEYTNTMIHRLLKGRTGYFHARCLELDSEYEIGCIF